MEERKIPWVISRDCNRIELWTGPCGRFDAVDGAENKYVKHVSLIICKRYGRLRVENRSMEDCSKQNNGSIKDSDERDTDCEQNEVG